MSYIKKIWLAAVVVLPLGAQEQYQIKTVDESCVAAHAQKIEKQEWRVFVARTGMQAGSALVCLAGLVALYRWSQSGVTVPEGDIAAVQAGVVQNGAQLQEIRRMLQVQSTDSLDALRKLEIENSTLKAELQKPFFTGITGGAVTWVKYLINNSIIGTAVAAGGYVVVQHGLPKIFTALDKIFYDFSYHWFLKNRTQMVTCFEELERSAYAYDNQPEQFEYQRRMFIWAWNQTVVEAEYMLAFMQVQNKYLAAHSFAYGRHMAVLTKHFKQIVDQYTHALGEVRTLPAGYANWTELVKKYRDALRSAGDSYAQTEQYVYTRIA